MAHMLPVPTLQVCYPMILFIAMKADDRTPHRFAPHCIF
jgi:hypothetical protein